MRRPLSGVMLGAIVQRGITLLIVGLVGLVSSSGIVAAEMGDASRREVDQLLGRVAQSGCEFYRSGSWFDGNKARDHLERKYRYLAARNLLGSAEDFVVMAATRSSMSNEAYAIRCHGGAQQPSAAWLTEELRNIRQSASKAPATPASR